MMLLGRLAFSRSLLSQNRGRLEAGMIRWSQPRARPVIILLFYLCRQTLAQSPHAATWSAEPFGPDEPWNAVQVSLGGQA
jgi:hypothetical protein